MHYLIKLIVEADDKVDALLSAENYGDDLVEQGEFDWFDMDGRWGESEAHKVKSKEGQRLLREGLDSTRREFDIAMNHIRYMVENFSDDDIYEEEFGTREEHEKRREENPDVWYLSRYMFAKADGRGNASYVYADGNIWGGPLQNEKALKEVLKQDKKLWVVPVDFHN